MLTDKQVKNLKRPAEGYTLTWDTGTEAVPGFGVRVTSGGHKAFVLNYRTRGGRSRRATIGRFPAYSVKAARKGAKEWHGQIDKGGDPAKDKQDERDAPSFQDLVDFYIERHLPKKRPASQKVEKATIEKVFMPRLGKLKVAEITSSDIEDIHHRITKDGHPYRANRVLSLLHKMFSLKVGPNKWRPDNPCQGIAKNHEEPRERYLSPDELARLTKTLDAWPDQTAANAIRLLLYTGARRGEVLTAEWKQFDLAEGTWTKPSSHTKTKRVHKVPLSDEALAVLSKMQDERTKADRVSPYLFPGPGRVGHRRDLKRPWPEICKVAGISNLRVHDLRHSFASILVASGATLPMIGRLLGHTQVATTQRYAHLDLKPLRKLVGMVGAVVDGAAKAPETIVPLKGKTP